MIFNQNFLTSTHDAVDLVKLVEGFERSANRYGGDLRRGGKASPAAAAMKRRRDYLDMLERGNEASIAAEASRRRYVQPGDA